MAVLLEWYTPKIIDGFAAIRVRVARLEMGCNVEIGDIFLNGKSVRDLGATNEPKSMKEICEFAVTELGLTCTADELFNASPNGELFHVYDLYWLALSKKGNKLEVWTGDGFVPMFRDNKEGASNEHQ